MKRSAALCFAAVGSFFLSAFGSDNFSSAASVDAVTAATVNNRCTFNLPITATSTTATVTWTEVFANEGTAQFCWDIVDPPVNCRAVTSSERSTGTIELTGLNPSTMYYIYLEANKTGETPYAATGSFTTTGGNAVRRVASQRASGPLFRIRGREFIVESGLSQGDRFVFSDLSGRIIFSHIVETGERSFQFNRTGASVFLIRCIRNNRLVASRLFISTDK